MTETTMRSTVRNKRLKIGAGLRATVARRVDDWVMNRAQVLASRASRNVYPEAHVRHLRRQFTSLDRQARNGTPTKDYVESIAKAYEELWDADKGTILPSERLRQATIDQFHRIYYHSPKQTWQNTYYRGINIWKCPLDLWLYQEIMHEVRPDLIIETGTAFGGSAYYLADLCEIFGRGQVVSIDIKSRTGDLSHPRATFLLGSSTDPKLKQQVLDLTPPGATVMVILDSLHKRNHVLKELRLWQDMVTPGSYLIVEDGNVNGHPVRTFHGPGPWEAVDRFMKGNQDFVIDESKHKFLMTQNPRGYLKRVDRQP